MPRVFLFLAGLLVIGAVPLARTPARAQDGEAARDPVHFGAGSCAAQACHGGAFEERQEYRIWSTRDKHAKAFDSLESELGQRIGARLDLDPTRSARCLNCHGTAGVRTADTFDPHDGVSCEQCHGGAEHWLGPHAAPAWKRKTAADKERLGLKNLKSPKKRVAVCVSCHVGGPGRDITHDIMAAGHPPLVFEAVRFQAAMPPHWVEKDTNRIPLWAEGQRAIAAARLGHLERLAHAAKGTPDFTVFDCDACHHPVYTGSVYEKTEPPGGAGHLPLELSSLDLFLEATGDAAARKRFDRLFRSSFGPESYGRDLAALARDMAGEIPRIAPDADEAGRAEADRYLKNLDARLARIEAGQARAGRAQMQQIALALAALAPDATTPAFKEAWAALDAALAPDARYDAAACAKLARAALR